MVRTERNTRHRSLEQISDKKTGWARRSQPVSYGAAWPGTHLSVGGVGLARRDSVWIGGKRANVRGPHAIRNRRMRRSRGTSGRDIAAGSHSLGCEYGCRNQRGRQERHFGHVFLHMVKEAKEVRLLCLKCGEPCVVKSKHSFTRVQACAIG